jgi:hypothetical protein
MDEKRRRAALMALHLMSACQRYSRAPPGPPFSLPAILAPTKILASDHAATFHLFVIGKPARDRRI